MRAVLSTLALSACCQPAEGQLRPGTWGGDPDPTSLTVYEDGLGSLDLACIGGAAVEPMRADAGRIALRVSFVPDSWRPDLPDDPPPFIVRLDGTVCGDTLTARVSSDDPEIGDGYDLTLVFGASRGFEVPCAQ